MICNYFFLERYRVKCHIFDLVKWGNTRGVETCDTDRSDTGLNLHVKMAFKLKFDRGILSISNFEAKRQPRELVTFYKQKLEYSNVLHRLIVV